MEHQLLLTLSPADTEGDEKRVSVVNKNLDKVRVDAKEGLVSKESQFIKLGLGICADGFQEARDVNIEESKVLPVISINHLKEVHQQVVIFSYIAAGVCVPSKLVVPIWKSVASSVCGSLSSGLHSNISSYFYPQGINYKSLMDSEPGRCRRTDGKKWRCRKDVVPDTKYCERHMHRGCSRKRVETCGITSQSHTPTTYYSISSTPITNCRKKTSLKLKSQNPDETSAKLSKNTNAVVENDQSSRETNDDIDSVDTVSDNINDKKENSREHGRSTTPEPNTSSRSVVCGNTVYEHVGVTAEEPQRCKRTDGKRWRCSKEAMPQQKYCGNHMNRGSKRFRQSSMVDTHEVIPAVKVKSDQTNWNKDLSISLGKFPLPTVVDVDISTSSDDHRH